MMRNTRTSLFVVFGGAGDLMGRKLLPALFELQSRDKFEGEFVVLAVSRRDWNDERYRDWARDIMKDADHRSESIERWCRECLYFQSTDREERGSDDALASRIAAIEEEHGLPGNRVFYLATPPGVFSETVQRIGAAGLHQSRGWTKLVVEKPFGQDLKTAQELNQVLWHYFDESQVYRIDHYLGKETVQNLLVFRFANMLFESAWNRHQIANIQITVAEDLGVGERAGYYDRAGALRDMMQNHATQLLTLIAMDAPPRFIADAVRDEKLRVLRAIQPIRKQDVILGQYGEGEVDGHPVPAYREEKEVPPDSSTETYAALKLSIDNWRWQGVPFYLRTGKRLAEKVTEIAIVFRQPPLCLFQALGKCAIEANVLRIRLQPAESFRLDFDVKVPGTPFQVQQQRLEFRYADTFGGLPDAYHTLIPDIVDGDQTHFVRADEAEAAWELYTPLLEDRPEPRSYAAGTWGPAEASELLRSDGVEWSTG